MTEPDFLRDTRASYDVLATGYAERFRDELTARPLDRAMLAFQVSDEVVHVAEARGHPVALDYRWRRPERVAEWLGRAGLEVRAQLLRAPDDDGDFPEQEPQAFLLAANPRSS